MPDAPRFPLLIKLLDAQEKLSLQVHPPPEIAESLGGEAKTEFWYVFAAEPNAEIFVGLRKSMTRDQFENALHSGTVADCVHPIRMKNGDAMFLPSGRFHAIGAGNILVEVQQNSDTTYRVFDWNRVDDHGERRQLHVDQALQCIDFNDVAPEPITPSGELLVRHELFEVQKWRLDFSSRLAPLGQFAIVLCLTGALQCAGVDFTPGEFFLVPASLQERIDLSARRRRIASAHNNSDVENGGTCAVMSQIFGTRQSASLQRRSNLGHPSAVVVNRWNVDTMIHFGVVLEANRRRYWKL